MKQKHDSELTPEQYHIAREKGTERPFTGKYWNCFAQGRYHCYLCGAKLFDSQYKFDAGCGWPSFDRCETGAIVEHEDRSLPGHIRTEVVCSQCHAHLGHVFEDGPTETGLRYCINSAVIHLDNSTEE